MKIKESMVAFFYKLQIFGFPLFLIRVFLAHYNKLLRGKTFSYNGVNIPYFYHQYNATYANERKIEVPIGSYYLGLKKYSNILEIGNVTSHYFPSSHVVVDKYEKDSYKNLVNLDILDYSSDKKYDFIFALSTFEHIGFDETPMKKDKLKEAIEYVYTELLSEDGLFLLTVPFGYNDFLDTLVQKITQGLNPFSFESKNINIEFFKRNSQYYWNQEESLANIEQYTYGKYYNCANSICIIRIYK